MFLSKLVQMRPGLTANNATDRVHADSIFIGQGLLEYPALGISAADFAHLFLSEFRAVVRFAFRSIVVGLTSLAQHVGVVVSMGAGKQVCRIAAWRIVAAVTDDQPLGDRSVGEFISETMGTKKDIPLRSDYPIAVVVPITCPLPAFIRFLAIHTRPESRRVVEHRELMPDMKSLPGRGWFPTSTGTQIWHHHLMSIIPQQMVG
jgi:hypothetical protein